MYRCTSTCFTDSIRTLSLYTNMLNARIRSVVSSSSDFALSSSNTSCNLSLILSMMSSLLSSKLF